jgi:rubrerythrin
MLSETMSLELKESRTVKNLIELFAREAQALICYRRFASTARHEGFPAVAEMFERLAQNQVVLVEGHLDFLRMVGDPLSGLPLGHTSDNLDAALSGEESSGELYQLASRTAEGEGLVDIASWLQSTAASKRLHRQRISEAITSSKETGGR